MQMEQSVDWSDEKNELLKDKFGFGFERVLSAISEGHLLDDRSHPNRDRYGHQFQIVVKIDNYAWVVPYVVNGDSKFLKTLFPSRVETRRHIGPPQ